MRHSLGVRSLPLQFFATGSMKALSRGVTGPKSLQVGWYDAFGTRLAALPFCWQQEGREGPDLDASSIWLISSESAVAVEQAGARPCCLAAASLASRFWAMIRFTVPCSPQEHLTCGAIQGPGLHAALRHQATPLPGDPAARGLRILAQGRGLRNLGVWC